MTDDVTVTKTDKNAAHSFCHEALISSRQQLRLERDFARHRMAAEQSQAARIAELEAEVRRLQNPWRPIETAPDGPAVGISTSTLHKAPRTVVGKVKRGVFVSYLGVAPTIKLVLPYTRPIHAHSLQRKGVKAVRLLKGWR